MRALVDTHSFVWWTGEPARLSQPAIDFWMNPENQPILSLASIWEMQIKLSLGKLSLKLPLSELVEDEVKRNRLSLLPIAPFHIYALDGVPMHHRDPFDRLLVTQAVAESLAIVSVDEKLDAYGIQRLW